MSNSVSVKLKQQVVERIKINFLHVQNYLKIINHKFVKK
jgi:hypothetical protein